MEIWKDIPGYEGLYQVSDFGRVKSLPKLVGCGYMKDAKILKPHKTKKGYLRVALSRDGRARKYSVHRLVLETFVPRDDMANLDCNHNDENKENCRLDNLCWMSRKENSNWGTRAERAAKTKSIQVYCRELNKTFDSITAASMELHINKAHIGECCRGMLKTCGGYHWRYVE